MAWVPAQLVGAADTGGLIDLATQAGLYQDSAGATPITADLQPLGRLVAKANAGTALVLTQATSSAKPTWRDLAPRRANFDGSDWLTVGSGRFGRAGLFAGPGESWSVVIAGSVGNGTLLARALSATAGLRTLQWYNNGSQAAPALGAHVRGAANQAIAQPGGLGTVFVAGLRWDGAALRTRVNNTLGTLTAGTAAEENTPINLGARANGTVSVLPSGSWFGQVFLIDRYLSDQEWAYLFYSMAQAVGLSGIGTAPPVDSVVLDSAELSVPVVVEAAAISTHTTLGSADLVLPVAMEAQPIVTATSLASVDLAVAPVLTAASLTTHTTLDRATLTVPVVVTPGSLGGAVALESTELVVPVLLEPAAVVTHTALESAAVAAPMALEGEALVTHTVLGSAELVVPVVIEAAALMEPPRVLPPTGRVHSRALGTLRSQDAAPVLSSRPAHRLGSRPAPVYPHAA